MKLISIFCKISKEYKKEGIYLDNLIFSLNATVPVFAMMLLGMLFKKMRLIDDDFASKMNKFVFVIALPVLLFEDLATTDFYEVWDFSFVFFCFMVTVLSIILVALISYFLDRSIQGEFIQASYRSSAALMGIALIQNIYGNASMAPLMIIGSVPLYNMMAVVVLSFFQPEREKMNKDLWIKTLKGIVTNPIIIAIIIGLIWSVLKIPMEPMIGKTVSYVGSVATPLGLMAMGATFHMGKVLAKIKPILLGSFMKLMGFCIVFLPIAVMLGFQSEQLVAILIMLGSPTTVSCYIMARNMKHEGSLTSGVIMLTTLLSAFSITLWLFILRSLVLI